MIEGRSGGSWRGTRRELWAPLERFFNQRIARCIVYRRSTLAAHSFPSLRRFLTLAPACWSRGKIPPHPSARPTRRSTLPDAERKGTKSGGGSRGAGLGKKRGPQVAADSRPADRPTTE